MTDVDQTTPPMAQPRVAAGALFTDDQGRVLMVRPTYKDYWDIPGGYVEPGESPRAACQRELKEELGLALPVGRLLVVDWAPHPAEGEKVLFIFAGGGLRPEDTGDLVLQQDEIAEARFVSLDEVPELTIERLAVRISSATRVLTSHQGDAYLEFGRPPST
jgi:ADP-ribose pyrophosphatase YjhB (NUDIX family)